MANNKVRKHLYSSVGPVLLAAMSLATTDASWAPCTGPGAPTTTQTKCLTAVQIPGNPLRSFDISWVNPDRAEYYLADRSNAGIDIIDTQTLKCKRTIGALSASCSTSARIAVNNNLSGPDGVTSHGRWLYAGDGDSTLKVIDLNAPTVSAIKQTISTGGTTRVDEMALTTDGKLLLAANNAEDPPFATLFKANGDAGTSNVSKITKITVELRSFRLARALSIEQPAWDPKTERFYTSIPIIANNPPGCNYGQLAGADHLRWRDAGDRPDPTAASANTIGAFDPATNTGVVPLHGCGPNGATVGPHDNLMLGCTPGNNPSNTTTLVINAKTKTYANIGNITGSDEVWFNSGDRRYYLGASKDCRHLPRAASPRLRTRRHRRNQRADREHPAVGELAFGRGRLQAQPDLRSASCALRWSDPVATHAVGAGICGGTNGCVAVYQADSRR